MARGKWARPPKTTDPNFVPFEPGRAVGHIPEPTSGCWNYVGPLDLKGYGKLHFGKRGTGATKRAHRVYYERAYGPLASAIQLDHLCRNRRCVNPEHLQPVTNAVNCQRQARSKLTEETVRALREEYEQGGISFKKLAAKHGLKKGTVQLAVMGLHWRNVK